MQGKHNYPKRNPMYMNEEEELVQQPSSKQMMSRKNMKNCLIKRNKQYQGEFNPECLVQNQRQFWPQYEDEETSGSTSSSTSDSDTSTTSSTTTTSESEEECYPRQMSKSRKAMKHNLFQQHQQQRLIRQGTSGAPRKWFSVVNVEGFRPKDVIAKLNPKCRILVIKAKQNVKNMPFQQQQSQHQMMMGSQVLEVIVLPENIHLQQIKVQMTPNGQLIVKAPFVLPNEQQQTRYPSTWIPIHVTLKDVDTLNYPQESGLGSSLGLSKRHQQYEFGMPINAEERINPMGKCGIYYTPRKQYQTIEDLHHQCFIQQGLQQQTSFSKLFRPEYIRDTVTGKVVMLIKVNTFGFLPKDVTVCVNQNKGFLVVEANKKYDQQTFTNLKEMSKQQLLEEGIPVKYLCREFVLPKYLDINHIGYYVMKNGLLLIKLPIEKSQVNKLQELGNINVQEGQLKNINWETPMTV